MLFSEQLLRFRARNDLSMRETGEILGVSTNMIYRYEIGQNKPSPKNLIIFKNKMEEYERSK